MLKDLTPAAWEFLTELGERRGVALARSFCRAMAEGFITHLDGEGVLTERNPVARPPMETEKQMRLGVGG